MADLLTGQMFCQVSVSDTTFTGRLDILILGLERTDTKIFTNTVTSGCGGEVFFLLGGEVLHQE